jgi:hypothetical protein
MDCLTGLDLVDRTHLDHTVGRGREENRHNWGIGDCNTLCAAFPTYACLPDDELILPVYCSIQQKAAIRLFECVDILARPHSVQILTVHSKPRL